MHGAQEPLTASPQPTPCLSSAVCQALGQRLTTDKPGEPLLLSPVYRWANRESEERQLPRTAGSVPSEDLNHVSCGLQATGS